MNGSMQLCATNGIGDKMSKVRLPMRIKATEEGSHEMRVDIGIVFRVIIKSWFLKSWREQEKQNLEMCLVLPSPDGASQRH